MITVEGRGSIGISLTNGCIHNEKKTSRRLKRGSVHLWQTLRGTFRQDIHSWDHFKSSTAVFHTVYKVLIFTIFGEVGDHFRGIPLFLLTSWRNDFHQCIVCDRWTIERVQERTREMKRISGRINYKHCSRSEETVGCRRLWRTPECTSGRVSCLGLAVANSQREWERGGMRWELRGSKGD